MRPSPPVHEPEDLPRPEDASVFRLTWSLRGEAAGGIRMAVAIAVFPRPSPWLFRLARGGEGRHGGVRGLQPRAAPVLRSSSSTHEESHR